MKFIYTFIYVFESNEIYEKESIKKLYLRK